VLRGVAVLAGCLVLLALQACGDGVETPAETAAAPDVEAEIEEPQVPVEEPPVRLPTVLGSELTEARYDLQGTKERGILRVLVGYSHTHYFMDGLNIRGISAENLRRFDPFLQERLGSPRPRINILPIPVARDEMIDFLAAGLADLAVGNITITDARAERVNFSRPLRRDVSELVIHHSDVGDIDSLEALAGRDVHVRRSSSFVQSLEGLNASLLDEGLAPVNIVAVDEHLQTEDILDLVNAGVIPVTVADSHMADFWSGIHESIVVRHDLALQTNRQIAWAIRRDLDGLKPIVDDFIGANREGTLVGNVLFQRYLEDNAYVHNASASADRRRFQAMTELFQRYSKDYDFDWLLIAAQAYQESRLVQSRTSPAGAIGVMQLLPSTAMSPVVGISNIDELEANIHAGHKYLRHIVDHYFSDPEIDELNRHLFSFAAYNAGPTRISRLRREAAARGLDPNVWFGNVERVVAEKVSREPVTYVRNIFKYYVTYKLMQDRSNSGNAA
jgi:membrane-bound lytic murein transglycosylase MltF